MPGSTGMYDIVMVTADETNAERNWRRLRELAPQAIRIDGAASVQEAYGYAAAAVTTPHFFFVDGDNWLLDGFGFGVDFSPRASEILLWLARNPVNDLITPHGAIKLLPTQLTRQVASGARAIDVALSIGTDRRVIGVTASEHRFNTSPFEAWRTAFRECAKLASRSTPVNAQMRKFMLNAWCRKANTAASFAKWCLLGARQGRFFGARSSDDPKQLQRLNDFVWLRRVFDQLNVRS
jgi:hypothetical protein